MNESVAFFDALLRAEIDLWNVLDAAVQGDHGISLGRLQALRAVRDRGGKARVQDVADDLTITVGAASKLVDRLERDGFAQREPNPNDRRSSLIALTAAGLELTGQASVTFEQTLAASLPAELAAPADLASMTATLTRLAVHLGHSRTAVQA